MSYLRKIMKDVASLHDSGYEVEIHLGRLLFHEVLKEVNALTGRDDMSMRINNAAVFFRGSEPFLCEYRIRRELD